MEIDTESVEYLQQTFPLEHIKLDTSKEKFNIIEGDFLKNHFQKTFQQRASCYYWKFPL